MKRIVYLIVNLVVVLFTIIIFRNLKNHECDILIDKEKITINEKQYYDLKTGKYIGPKIALFIRNINSNDEEVINLLKDQKNNLSFGFLPYGRNIADYFTKYQNKDLYINLPVEYKNNEVEVIAEFIGLSAKNSFDENVNSIDWVLNHAYKAKGIYINAENDLFHKPSDTLKYLCEQLRARNMNLLYLGYIGQEFQKLLNIYNVKILPTPFVFDDSNDFSYFENEFINLKENALKNNLAIGILDFSKITIKVLDYLIERMHNDDILFVKLSDLIE